MQINKDFDIDKLNFYFHLYLDIERTEKIFN